MLKKKKVLNVLVRITLSNKKDDELLTSQSSSNLAGARKFQINLVYFTKKKFKSKLNFNQRQGDKNQHVILLRQSAQQAHVSEQNTLKVTQFLTVCISNCSKKCQ